MERAVATRRAEFTTGRACAREALTSLGAPAEAVPVGEKRAPVWPDGVVGSITHTARVPRRGRGVALGGALGGDRRRGARRPARRGARGGVLGGRAARWSERLAASRPEVSWDRLLFSAKESVYKTWFPLTGRWLGFEDAELVPSEDGTFRARLLVEGPTVDGVVVSSFDGVGGPCATGSS